MLRVHPVLSNANFKVLSRPYYHLYEDITLPKDLNLPSHRRFQNYEDALVEMRSTEDTMIYFAQSHDDPDGAIYILAYVEQIDTTTFKALARRLINDGTLRDVLSITFIYHRDMADMDMHRLTNTVFSIEILSIEPYTKA